MAMAMAAGAAIPVLSHVLTAFTSLRTSLESNLVTLLPQCTITISGLANPLGSKMKELNLMDRQMHLISTVCLNSNFYAAILIRMV